MSNVLRVDTNLLEWENGLTVLATLAPEFRNNLGPPDLVEDLFKKYKLLCKADEFDVVILQPSRIAFSERFTSDAEAPLNQKFGICHFAVIRPTRIRGRRRVRWVPDYNREPLGALDLIHGLCLVSECWNRERQPICEVVLWLKSIREVDPGSFFAAEPVPRLKELYADLQISDRVRRHQELVPVEPGQEIRRDIFVPQRLHL